MANPDPFVTQEALESEVQALLEEMRQSRFASFEERSLAWLSLVPAWTLQLARFCNFPTGNLSLDEFLAQVLSKGLCTQNRSTNDDSNQPFVFWMPETTRTEVLEDLSEKKSVVFLQQELSDIGQRISNAYKQGETVSPVVFRWAQLATQTKKGLKEAGRWLVDQIQRSINEDDTAEALAWVRTGSSLAEVLRGELEVEVFLGNNRIDREYRRRQDERYLQHFLPRTEQISDFSNLIEGSNDVWALHYIGLGGVGKTMLLRYITAKLASEFNAITSRVDFDHINPDYPTRAPGQLLLELADQLGQHISSSSNIRSFELFRNQVTDLHEALSAEPPPDQPLANIHRPEFERVQRAFINLLTSFPQRAVLILDTCEELNKLQPVGSIPPSVAGTFEILEQIHKAVPSMRVVLAGRRELAKSGYGWHIEESSLSEGTKSLLQHKPYLRLHEIRGFNEDEVQEFFTIRKLKNLSSQVRDAILSESRDNSTVRNIVWDVAQAQNATTRYNPFKLALYADWLSEEPELSVADITAGETDPYVEKRIVNRLKPELQIALPFVTLLCRFDRAMLRPALEVSDATFNDIFRELSDQEWINCQHDRELESTFLEVEPNTYHPALLKYYQHPSRLKRLTAAMEQLAPQLKELVQRDCLVNQLSVEYVDAAVRLLGTHEGVEQAAALWEDIVRRLSNEANWSWGRRVAERLLAENGAVGEVYSSIRASVQATYIASLIHEQPGSTLITVYWDAVEQTASEHPDLEVRNWLALRAQAGKITASISAPQRRPTDEQLETLWQVITEFPQKTDEIGQRRAEQLAASLCAAVEAVLDFSESKNDLSLVSESALSRLHKWTENLRQPEISKEILAFALTLIGWGWTLHKRWDEAKRTLDQTLVTLSMIEEESEHQCWLDWRMPSCLRDRIRLEVLRLLPPWLNSVNQNSLNGWQREALENLESIDSERLASYILKLRLDKALVLYEELIAIARNERYDADRQPVCAAHHAVLPLFATLSLGWLAIGEGHQALERLNERLNEAIQTRSDSVSRRAAEWTKMQVVRRQRLYDHEITLTERLSKSKSLEDRAIAWSVIALGSSLVLNTIPQPNRKLSPDAIHAWWSSQCTLTFETAIKVIETGRNLFPDAIQYAIQLDNDLDRLMLELDLQEAILVSEMYRMEPLGWQTFTFEPESYRAFSSAQLDKIFRLMLRASVLVDSYDLDTQWAEQSGWRWMAKAALEEGELLALRLPKQAVPLLDMAHDWFLAANDPVGATIAAVCSAIAAIHGRNNDLAREKLSERGVVNLSYQQLKAGELGSNLPEWGSLITLRDEMKPDELAKLHPSWEEWLTRLFYCLIWLEDPVGEGKLAIQAQRWLLRHYGQFLPIELQLLSTEKRSVPPQSESTIICPGLSLSIAIPPDSAPLDLIQEPDLMIPVVMRLRETESVLRREQLPPEKEGQSQTPGLRPYREASEDIPRNIVTRLLRLAELQGDHQLSFPLQIDPTLAPCAWEAALTLALPWQKGSKEVFQFWRFGEALPDSWAAQSGWKTGRVQVISSRTWTMMLEKGWKSLASRVIINNNVSQLKGRLKKTKNRAVKILHLIGTPISTSTGIHLEISESRYSISNKEQSQTLVRADELPLTLPSLVIIQSEPSEALRRTETEREQMTCLRAYASEIFTAGAQAVLVLPTLPHDLAEQVLSRFAKKLSLQSKRGEEEHNPSILPDLWKILDAVTSVRQTVAQWTPSASDPLSNTLNETESTESARTYASTLEELALDICLFARLGKLDMEALSLLDCQLNPRIRLLSEEIERLKKTIEGASPKVKRQIFRRSQQVRKGNWKDNKLLMERTIPVFEALAYGDTRNRFDGNYGQLGYALKDKRKPTRKDWVKAEAAFTMAIDIRQSQLLPKNPWYQFNRAICRIQLDKAFAQKQVSSDDVRLAILIDLRIAAEDSSISEVLLKNDDPNVFNPIPDWLQLNSLTDLLLNK